MILSRRDFLSVLGFFSVLSITILLYRPGLNGDLIFDDFRNLEPLNEISLGHTTWHDVVNNNNSGSLGRPISMLTFVANQLSSGGLVREFKYTNIMLHILCGALVFWLIGRLSKETPFSHYAWIIALWTTSLWLLTPLHVSTVLYIIQRMAQLSTLFILAGLLSYTIGRQNLESNFRLGILLIASCFFVWLPLAVLSKENGILLPLLMFIVEVYVFRFRATQNNKRLLSIVYIVFLALPAILVAAFLIFQPDYLLDGYQARNFTLLERILTQTRALMSYVTALIIPNGSTMGVYHDDYIISKNLVTPITTLPSVLALVVVIFLSYKYKASQYSAILFGPVFFLGGHILESTIIPLEIYFEHRNYLPSIGLYFGLSLCLFMIYDKTKLRPWYIALIFLIPALHGFGSYQRVLVWQSRESILVNAYQNNKKSARVHADLALLSVTSGQYDAANVLLNDLERIDLRYLPDIALMKILMLCQDNKEIQSDNYNYLKLALKQKDANIPDSLLQYLLKKSTTNKCFLSSTEQFKETFFHWLSSDTDNTQTSGKWILSILAAQILDTHGDTRGAIWFLDHATELIPQRLESSILKLRYLVKLRDINNAWVQLNLLKEKDYRRRRDFTQTIDYYNNFLIKNKLLPDNSTISEQTPTKP